jgi:hypothetical protein
MTGTCPQLAGVLVAAAHAHAGSGICFRCRHTCTLGAMPYAHIRGSVVWWNCDEVRGSAVGELVARSVVVSGGVMG